MDTKWSNQGIPPPPSLSPSSSPVNFHTPDTSSNDSSLPDNKQPLLPTQYTNTTSSNSNITDCSSSTTPVIKKLKTLKPTITNTVVPSSPEKQQTTTNISNNSPPKNQINTGKY